MGTVEHLLFVLGNWAAPCRIYLSTLFLVFVLIYSINQSIKSPRRESYGNEGKRLLYMASVGLELRVEGCLSNVCLPEYRSRDAGIGIWWVLISGAGRRRFSPPHWRDSSRLRYLGRSVVETGKRRDRSNHLEG